VTFAGSHSEVIKRLGRRLDASFLTKRATGCDSPRGELPPRYHIKQPQEATVSDFLKTVGTTVSDPGRDPWQGPDIKPQRATGSDPLETLKATVSDGECGSWQDPRH
jgi:hypothetical protein